MHSGLEVSKHEKHAIQQHVLRHLLHGSAWASSGAVCPELRSVLLSSQNSLKASNRKKKRTSFKRKASKRGTEVSVSGSWSNEIHPLSIACPSLLFWYISHSFLLHCTLTCGILSILKNITSATSQSICTCPWKCYPKDDKELTLPECLGYTE